MFQVAIQFTYYHELAHLLQHSALLPAKLSEQYHADGFDPYKHLLEFDADCHAANFIFFHIQQYFREFPMAPDAKLAGNLIALYAAAIFIYFTFLDGSGPIYYQAGSHPHPVIRIIYITNLITETAQRNLPELGLDQVRIIRDAFDLAERFAAANGMPDPIERFTDLYARETAAIGEYLIYLSDQAAQTP